MTKYGTALGQARNRVTSIALELWINALLSNPVTHTANGIGNSLMLAWAVPERLLASTLSREVGAGEASALLYGLPQGLQDTWYLIKDGAFERYQTARSEGLRSVLRERESRFGVREGLKDDHPIRCAISAEGLQLDPLSMMGFAADVLGELVRLPGRGLAAADDIFKTLNYRMELQAQTYRMARSEGFTGDALRQRIAEIVANPQVDFALKVHDAAMDAAFFRTFTNDPGPARPSSAWWT